MTRKQAKITDGVLLVLLAFLLGLFLWRMFFSLNYHWNWQQLSSYIIQTNQATQSREPGLLLEGLFVTLRISLYGTIISLFIGFMIALFRISSRLLFRMIGRTYVELIRNLPPLVLIFIFYYFISDQILAPLELEERFRQSDDQTRHLLTLLFAKPGLIIQFLSGVVTLGLFQGAYVAEIIRGGIESIDKGQWEVGAALGLSRWQQLRRIILPQAMRIMLPQLANEFINTIKWSSIVSIISIQELTYNGMQAIASTGATMEVWIIVASMYFVVCLVLSKGVRHLEQRYTTDVLKVAKAE